MYRFTDLSFGLYLKHTTESEGWKSRASPSVLEITLINKSSSDVMELLTLILNFSKKLQISPVHIGGKFESTK